MGTVKDKLNLLLNTKSSIRQAISDMGQVVASTVPFSGYAAKIRAISSDATAAAADILSGKTAYAGGQKITGTIASKGAADLTASGPAVSVPAGYYPEDASKSVATAEQAVPGISVSSSGLITASAAQEAGYVTAGTKSATRQLTTQGAATITPGTSAKTAVAAGRYTTGAVQVAGDVNLMAENIKSGVSIFGIQGSMSAAERVAYVPGIGATNIVDVSFPNSITIAGRIKNGISMRISLDGGAVGIFCIEVALYGSISGYFTSNLSAMAGKAINCNGTFDGTNTKIKLSSPIPANSFGDIGGWKF